MVWPKLVPLSICATPVCVTLEDGVNEDGSPKVAGEYTGLCNYREEARWDTDGQRRIVHMIGVALIDGDISPGLESLSGTAVISGGQTRRISKGSRARNLDGTVNYTRLELL